MASYVVKNKVNSNIQIIVPGFHGFNKFGTSLTLEAGHAIDILPYAGTVDNCKTISFLRDLELRNLVEIICQP